MLSLPPTVRVFVVVEPADMRGSLDALAGATRRLGLDPVDGHLYLFMSSALHYMTWAFERLGTHRDLYHLDVVAVTPAAYFAAER